MTLMKALYSFLFVVSFVILSVLLILNNTAKMKLAMLAFLYCGEFVKNPIVVLMVVHWLEILLGCERKSLPHKIRK